MNNTDTLEQKLVKPYSQEGSKKQQVTEMFDNIAPKYDFLNRILSLGIDKIWRKKAINNLNSTDHRKILDVATGTADVAIEINKQLKPDEIIGLDISSEMINYGKKKINKANLSDTISLEVGDSENMRFSDKSFDAVTVAFGVRNFGNLEAGLAEIHRVLRNKGKVVILEFSKPKVFPLKQLFNFYFKHILPKIGNKTSKDDNAYDYLYESVQVFPDYEKFAAILKKVGFRSIEWKSMTIGICTVYTGIK